MNLNFLEKLGKILTLPFSSFLMIEIFIIFIILYIFFLYNIKRNSIKVKYILSALIIFFFSFLVFYFKDDFFFVIRSIFKILIKLFYFFYLIFYIFSVIISLIILIVTIFKNNKNKFNSVVTYSLSLIHLFLFTNFIAISISDNVSLLTEASIYNNDMLLVIVFFSQIVFIVLIIYKLIYHFGYTKVFKLKNNK